MAFLCYRTACDLTLLKTINKTRKLNVIYLHVFRFPTTNFFFGGSGVVVLVLGFFVVVWMGVFVWVCFWFFGWWVVVFFVLKIYYSNC